MNRIIALYGSSNKGKSTTIKAFAGLIQPHFGEAAQVEELLDHNSNKDYQLLVTINGKVKVGIESEGDPGGRLKHSLDRFVREKCDIIFCATRTRGTTTDFVGEVGKQGYAIEWVEQIVVSGESDQKQSNGRQAQLLLDKLIAFVNNK